MATPICNTQRVLVVCRPAQQNTSFYRDLRLAGSTRANLALDLASNTAYGPLIGHAGSKADLGNGLDSSRGPR